MMLLLNHFLMLVTVAIVVSGCGRDDSERSPLLTFCSHDRKIAVVIPDASWDIAGKRDSEDGDIYAPVFVYHFEDAGQTTIETNMCARSTSPSGNWGARTKDGSFTFVDNSCMYPEGTPENELHEIIVRDATGVEKTIYLERSAVWLPGCSSKRKP